MQSRLQKIARWQSFCSGKQPLCWNTVWCNPIFDFRALYATILHKCTCQLWETDLFSYCALCWTCGFYELHELWIYSWIVQGYLYLWYHPKLISHFICISKLLGTIIMHESLKVAQLHQRMSNLKYITISNIHSLFQHNYRKYQIFAKVVASVVL